MEEESLYTRIRTCYNCIYFTQRWPAMGNCNKERKTVHINDSCGKWRS